SHLTGNGYRFIGMDHFSREDGELAQAMDEGSLQRNFQGYSTHSGADLYAFGMSGISNVGHYYWQNSKELDGYYKALTKNQLPIIKTLELNRDDLLRREVIMHIMCRMEINKAEIEQKWKINFDRYFSQSVDQLDKHQKDGLVYKTSDKIIINEKGRLFLRNIAMCFDKYLLNKKKIVNFSKTV